MPSFIEGIGHIVKRNQCLRRCFLVRITSVLLFLFLCRVAQPDDRHPFRYFTSQDGLKESWVSSVTVGPSGIVWINHGDVDEMSVYDGYRFQTMPSPGATVRVYKNESGELWSLDLVPPNGFKKYSAGRWIDFELAENSPWVISSTTPFSPRSSKQILFINPEAFVQFNADENNVRVLKRADETGLGRFLGAIESPNGDLWISAEKGLARASSIPSASGSVDALDWNEYRVPFDLAIRNITRPLICSAGEITAVAESVSTGKQVVVVFDGENWSCTDLSLSENVLAAWRGHDSAFWIVTGVRNSWDLLYGNENQLRKIEKNRIFSGYFLDVTVELGCSFWIATSTGLAHYAPQTWRSPVDVERMQEAFTSIYQDPQDRLWFLYKDRLMLFEGGRWMQFPIPEGTLSNSYLNHVMSSLPDGRLVVSQTNGKLLLFHPQQERFEIVEHPNGSYIVFYAMQSDGEILIVAHDPEAPMRLERYDGESVQILYENIDFSEIGNIRSLFRSSDGVVWVGGLMGLAFIQNGEFHVVSREQGYSGYGAFSIAELPDRRLWFGGRDSITSFDGRKWETLRGSELETVRSIFPAKDGSVWVASGSGVHRFKDGSWTVNTHEDGLPDAAVVKVFQDARDRIWAATVRGLSLYYPQEDRFPPETYIDSTQNLSTTPPGGEVRLFFEGIDRWRQTVKNRLLYSHRIDGGDWSSFSYETIFSATNVLPGEHVFDVRTMDRNWNVDESPARFHFTVLLPWYKTFGFLIAASIGSLIVLFSLGYAVSRYFQLERTVAQRTAELASREALYRTLVENLKQFVFLKNSKLEFVSANSSFCDLVGLPLDAIVGKTDFDLFPKDLAIKYRADDLRVMQSKKTLQTVEKNESNQSFKWVEVVKSPVFDETGAIGGILGIFWDISERMQVEERLRQHQDLLELTQSVASIGSWDTNLTTGDLMWSDETYRILGLDREGFNGKIETFYSLIHPDDRDLARRASRNAVAFRKTYNFDHRIVRPDGSIRWVQERAQTIVNEKGEAVHLVGTVQDITDRKKAEEEIANLAKFPEENPNPVLRISSKGVILFANQASDPLLDFWKVRTGEALPLDWVEILSQIYQVSKNREIEIDSGGRIYLLGITPIEGLDYINIYGIDVTDKKRLEEQFRQSQKMEAVGQLAGGVAHDFNNLVMAIQGYGQFVLNELDPSSSLCDDVNEILKAADRAASLTRQLLAFSRKQVLQPKRLDLNQLILDMDKMLRRLIGEDVELSIHLCDDVGVVKADPGQIEQIVMNLSVNARDAMPQGGKLSLETLNAVLDENYAKDHSEVIPGPYVMLAVSDNGCGMNKETLERVFDPFFTTKEVGRGTGLGLSTVYGIVKQSGGSIWVYSEPGQGTTFKIYFPALIDSADVCDADSIAETASHRGSETILVVEDEAIVRKVVVRVLQENGYDVMEASNGLEAVRICERSKKAIHLVITDVIMPQMSGADLVDRLSESHPQISVLYMSGYTNNHIADKGVVDSEINFIQKPFAFNDLLIKIREILG